jgi:hypothetical protein
MNSYKIEYRIEICDFGILIFNPIPVGDLKAIIKLGKLYKCDIFDALLSNHLGASFCLISRKNSAMMRKKLGLSQ